MKIGQSHYDRVLNVAYETQNKGNTVTKSENLDKRSCRSTNQRGTSTKGIFDKNPDTSKGHCIKLEDLKV